MEDPSRRRVWAPGLQELVGTWIPGRPGPLTGRISTHALPVQEETKKISVIAAGIHRFHLLKTMNRHKPNLNQSVKTALCIAAASLLQIATALAQPYNIDWHCLAGGGGDGTGGDYTLNSTVGQPAGDVGVGGDYTLETGFWSVVDAIQSPDAPWLTITVTNGQITLSWPKPAEGWVLQRTPALAPQSGGTAWSDISPPYPTNPTHVLFAEPWTAGARYYRLHKP